MMPTDACQQAFYVVAIPSPHVAGPNMMLNVAMPQATAGWQLFSAQTCASEQATLSHAKRAEVASISGKVWQMSQDSAQCYEVQELLEDSGAKVKVAIAEELRGHICDAIRHPYANFVVQKCIETLRPEASQFIIDELMSADNMSSVAQHKFGCRIVQRLLEYCRADQVFTLVQQFLSEAASLINSHYGIYVIQHLLQYACREHQRYLLDLMIENTKAICSSNVSGVVVNAVLSLEKHDDSIALAHAILKNELLATMARSRHGHLAVKALLELLEGSFECGEAHRQLLASKEDLNKTRYGRSILRLVEGSCASDTRPVSEASKHFQREGNRRMSWADMSSDAEDDF